VGLRALAKVIVIHALTTPFAIDAVTFFVSAHAPSDRRAQRRAQSIGRNGIWIEIGEGLKLVWENRTLWGLAWFTGKWQFLHQMQVAVLTLFATREIELSAGAIGVAYACSGLGYVVR
jgi:hypothetical protein